jgi:peptide/nickel transport system substrate-binding protein
MHLRKRSAIVLTVLTVLALALLALAGCAPAAPSAPAADAGATTTDAGATAADAGADAAPAAGGSLTIGLGSEPETLDPGDAVYVQEQFVLISLFDSLLAMAPDGTLHPGLATAWEPNAEFTEFTFTLRDGVTFHDGTPFNAAAVQASFDHIMSDAVLESGGKTLLTDAGYTGTEVVDDDTVVVKFAQPYPTFLRDAARQWLSISSPAALEQYGADYGRNPVGTGPFRFVQWDAQSQVVLERNPDYNWGPEFATHQGPALLDQVVFRFLPEAATRLTAFQTGELLVTSEPPALDALASEEAGEGVLATFAQPGIPGIMMLNTEQPPLDDPNVRKALNLSLNHDEFVQTVYDRLGIPAHNVLSPTTWSYDEEAASLYRYDPAEAARLLDEAGWVDGDGDGIREKDGQPLTIDYITSPIWEEAFNELLAGYLAQAGFDVQMRAMDDAGIAAEATAGSYSMLYMYWTRADPSPLRILFHSDNIDGGAAYTRFRSAELDTALEAGATQTDEELRKQEYVTAQRIIMENALVLPLFTINTTYLYDPSVQNFTFDVEGYPWVYEMALAQE